MSENINHDPNVIQSHFDSFVNNIAPGVEDRRRKALVTAGKLRAKDKTPRLPSTYHGYNLLLANWGSSEDRLRQTYRLYRELAAAIEEIPLKQRIIVFGGLDVADVDSICRVSLPDSMEGPFTFTTGLLTKEGVDFQYRSKLTPDSRGIKNVRSPYLLASAGVRLSEIEEVKIDICSKEASVVKQTGHLSVVALGSNLDGRNYINQNFAEAYRMVAGDKDCEAFLTGIEEGFYVSI